MIFLQQNSFYGPDGAFVETNLWFESSFANCNTFKVGPTNHPDRTSETIRSPCEKVPSSQRTVTVVEVRFQGQSRPTATGSDISRDISHGADLAITLIAEQMGRSPANKAKGVFRWFLLVFEGQNKVLTMMDGHAVLLKVVALVNPAGVGEGPLIGKRGPGEATQVWSHQADVAPPAVVYGHVSDGAGQSAAHQAAVLAILAVGTRTRVGGRKLTVHPDVSLQVRQTWKHLRPPWREQKGGHGVHWKRHEEDKTSTYNTSRHRKPSSALPRNGESELKTNKQTQ